MSSRLFQLGHFTLHSGEESRWKIECEALSPDDWAALAEIIREHIPSFSSVLGIPRGGMPLQQALEVFGTGNMAHPLLLVDDVYTTGRSFDDMLVSVQRDGWTGPVFGVVAFARAPVRHHWVQAVWNLGLKEPFALSTWDPRSVRNAGLPRDNY